MSARGTCARIQELAGRLARKSQTRAIAQEVLTDCALSVEQVVALWTALDGPPELRTRERLAAICCLGYAELPVELRTRTVEHLCAVLEDRQIPVGSRCLLRLRHALLRTAIPCLVLAGIAAVIALITWLGSPAESRPLPMLALLLTGMAAFVASTVIVLAPFVSLSTDWDASISVRSEAAAALERLEAPESVGFLAEACDDNSLQLRMMARRALRAVRPHLSERHYALLPLATTPQLCRLLWQPDWTLTLEAVEALGKVGDGRAMEAVERLAARAISMEVTAAALRVLPVLRARHGQENNARTLLRAADSDPSLLLRAPSDSHADPTHLLRPETRDSL